MPTRLRTILVVALLLGSAATRADDLTISLPLGPWYRPGKYLPVHVTATLTAADPQTLTISTGPTGVRTTLPARPGRVDVIVPLLPTTPRAVQITLAQEGRPDSVQSPELRPLANTDRLVAWTTPDESGARQLLGAATRLVPVLLDPADFFKFDPAAWGALDAILLDAGTASRLTEPQLVALHASGVIVAIKTDRPPLPAWPWKQQGEYAVLAPALAGPASGTYLDAAYLPVADWQPGHPWPERRRLLVVALLCCLPLLALALWRPRFTTLWAIAIAVLLCAALLHWQRSILAVRQAAGEIVLLPTGGVTQTDRWTYLASPIAVDATLPWQAVTWPLTSGDLPITLACDGDGKPVQWLTRISASRKLAFLSRAVGLRSPHTPPQQPVTSPLAPLVEAAYLDHDARTLGQLPAPTVDDGSGRSTWNAIVVERRKDAPR